MQRKELTTPALAIGASAVAGVIHYTEVGEVAAFVSAAVALSLLAVMVGHGTEQLGRRLPAGVTGVLQGAFGNLPELLISIFSLRAGLTGVVHAAIVGSILANLLLVMGLAILLGGLKHGTQRFNSEPPKMVATLMLLAVAALSIPTLAYQLHTPAQAHEPELGAAVAVVLLLVFGCSLAFSLRADPTVTQPSEQKDWKEEHAHPAWPLGIALLVLGVAGVGAAFVSEWFVDALTPTMKSLGISETFAGLVIVAVAGNAVENLVGIKLAVRNKPDYAMSVVLNSSLQIALAMTPILVLASFFIGPTPLTLVISPLLVAALALSAIIATVIVVDGETIWIEGVALVGLYAIIAASVWWG